MRLNLLKSSKGFTLVEVLMAMALFSFMLLVMSTGIMRLYQMYQQGHEIRNTQQSVRAVADALTRDTHDADYVIATPNTVCLFRSVLEQDRVLTGVRYERRVVAGVARVYRIRAKFTDVDVPPTTCTTSTSDTATEDVLTSNRVDMRTFTVASGPAANPRLLSVRMSAVAVSGAGDVEPDPNNAGLFRCRDRSDLCSVTNLETAALSHREIAP